MPSVVPASVLASRLGTTSQEIYGGLRSGELVIAVVGHVGSGTSTIADELKTTLEAPELAGGPYDATVLKARDAIIAWADMNGRQLPATDPNDLEYVTRLQDLGDEMRHEMQDYAAVARALVAGIRATRATKQGVTAAPGTAVVPDGTRRAYILDSIRHPAELSLVRQLYRPAFALVGVVCDTDIRKKRLSTKFRNAGDAAATGFMGRDEDSGLKHGQRVGDTFHLADYFINNTEVRLHDDDAPNPDWDVPEQLHRFIKILTKSEVVRPERAETAMHAAYGAKVRSACLSRQVGACLVDRSGTIVATGTNEVPRGGGGVYPDESVAGHDHRCAYRNHAFCSNTREQNQIINTLLDSLGIPKQNHEEAFKAVRAGPVGRLLEFSRAVHAEMETLLTAGRSGRSTQATRMFVTTFPCHYCARHLVSAGVDEVQYIEPYSKSQALSLHGDAITASSSGWTPPSAGGKKVLFRPFTGVAPQLYERAFNENRELKNKATGAFEPKQPEWGGAWARERTSYPELEAELAKAVEQG